MLLIGKNITQSNDHLTEVSVERIYTALKNADGEVAALQNRLQIIRGIDVNQYRKMKTALPYIVCAQFYPKIRRKENFVSTKRFLVDIDHLSEFEIDKQDLEAKLKSDKQVELLFSSPSGDGLKVLFKLSEKITDSGYYSMFYKSFCLRFMQTYQLGAAVDIKTCDVSRCCFVSFDPDVYYNADAEPILASEYLNEECFTELDGLKLAIADSEKSIKQEKEKLSEPFTAESRELSDDVLTAIRLKIGQKIKAPQRKWFEQPEELETLIPQILEQLESIGAQLQKNTPIAYGRQITVKAVSHWAEVNIFYGKKGVRIVGTTKTGSNKTLCDMIVQLLKSNFENN